MTRDALLVGSGAIALLAAALYGGRALLLHRGAVAARRRFGLPATVRANLVDGCCFALLGTGALLTAWTGQEWWQTGLLLACVPIGFVHRVLEHDRPAVERRCRAAAARRRVPGLVRWLRPARRGHLSLEARHRRF